MKKIGYGLLLFICLLVASCGLICGAYLMFYEPPPPLQLTIREFTPCLGWDDDNEIIVTQSFLSTDDYLAVCGQVETNRSYKIAIVVHWFHEGSSLSREVVEVNTRFVSSLQRPENETFEAGTYRVDVVAGRHLVRTVEFQVE